jgi:hypothetical protein
MNKQRRIFMLASVATGVAASTAAFAQTKPAAPAAPAAKGMPMVDEADATAKSLGYVADAKKADAKKYKQYAAGQTCANCQLYTGKANEASGPCSIFPGKQVAAKGWCSAWVKKAG